MTGAESHAPFLVEHLRLPDASHPARYVPAARLVVLTDLRTSGLLSTLPGEEVKSLLALLTFLSANGHVSATLFQLAQALGINEGKCRARMERLITFVWQGEPLVREVRRELGLDAYVPSPKLFMQEERHEREREEAASEQKRRESEAAEAKEGTGPTVRDAIYAQNRALYAKPRAEVEREVMRLLGHAPEEADDTPEGAVRRRLSRLGVPAEDGERLISSHPLETITDQLDWLPQRNAKNPARFVVAAIENGYEPPLAVVRERRVRERQRLDAAQEALPPEHEGGTVSLNLPEHLEDRGVASGTDDAV